MHDGYKGLVREVSFYTSKRRDEAINNLKFEASNDDFLSETVLLKVVGNELVEGWNTYDISNLEPAYKSYRLRGSLTEDNSCNNIGEIRFLGYEVHEGT